MTFSNNEYEISEHCQTITITKKCLEEWREHYANIVKFKKDTAFPNYWYYVGKQDVIIDILKMFEPLEG